MNEQKKKLEIIIKNEIEKVQKEKSKQIENDIDIIIIPKRLSHLSPEFVAKKFVQKKQIKLEKLYHVKVYYLIQQ